MNKKILAYAALGISAYMLVSMSVGLYKTASSIFKDHAYEPITSRVHLTNTVSTNLESTVEAKK